MDIYSFINSPDISNYLQKIDYEFNSLETAWLIYQCQTITYKEKKKNWEELIRTMPDCEIPQRGSSIKWPSLHEVLKRYIQITDRDIEAFFQAETRGKYVYMYDYYYTGDPRYGAVYDRVFGSLQECLEAYQQERSDMDSGDGKIEKWWIKKQALAHPEIVQEVVCLGDGRVIDMVQNTARTEEEDDIIDQFFEELWFDFPTPFKKGDIVWEPNKEMSVGHFCEGVYVLEELATWTAGKFVREKGSYADMANMGYSVNSNGTVYYDHMGNNYMNTEYYKGTYDCGQKILPAISKMLKGEIRVDRLLCEYRKVLADAAEEDMIQTLGYILSEK